MPDHRLPPGELRELAPHTVIVPIVMSTELRDQMLKAGGTNPIQQLRLVPSPTVRDGFELVATAGRCPVCEQRAARLTL